MELHVGQHRHAVLEELHAEAVMVALAVARQEAGGMEGRDDPVDRAARHLQAGRDLGDGEVPVDVRETVENLGRLEDRPDVLLPFPRLRRHDVLVHRSAADPRPGSAILIFRAPGNGAARRGQAPGRVIAPVSTDR